MKKYILLLMFPIIGFSQPKVILTTKDSVKYHLEKIDYEAFDLKAENVKMMRVSYIYFDGSILSKEEIDKKREEILVQVKKGKPFSELANQYTMDGSKNGDLGWFEQGVMVKAFEDAIIDNKKGAIFKVDIPENKWYYVVLKSFDDINKIKITLTDK